MRRRTRQLWVLAAAALGLGAAVCAQLAHERHLRAAQRLTTIDPSAVTRLDVSCRQCRTRRFRRTTSGWHMLAPYALPASADAVAHLLRIARAPVRTWLDAQDYVPSRLGLAPPLAELTLDHTRIAIGAEDPVDHDRYIRVGTRLARVPDRFSARLFEAPESELDAHLVPVGTPPADVIIGAAAPRRDLNAVWQAVVAGQVRASTTNIAADAIPITINLPGGATIRFALYRTASGYVARRYQPALDYLLDEAQVQALLGKI